MDVEQFFTLLVKETKENTKLQNLYRFAIDENNFLFRKAYYCQRLGYIKNHIHDKNSLIWDCGCGYGTTGIFLALNGFNVYGTTVEYFYEHIPKRFDYWKQYGDISGFTVDYQNIFDPPFHQNKFDFVITQDVLHHLEPNHEALEIIRNSMKDDGKLVVCEENGNNIINNFKLFMRRGNKKIIDIYDEKLNKTIKLGNENIQGLSSWKSKFNKAGMKIDDDTIEYIRLFPPFWFSEQNYRKVLEKENRIWRKNRLAKEYFFFGINYTVCKT
ncbi:MAG: class I SAM-dependent methyltransferase [Bacteroidales bacterium]